MDHKEMSARGGKKTAAKLTPEERSARAKKAVAARWDKAAKEFKEFGKRSRAAAEEAIEKSKDGTVEKAIRKSKTREPWVGPAKVSVKGEIGMPGHSEHCQCMGCRAYRSGWRP